jgi:hypothetical protein
MKNLALLLAALVGGAIGFGAGHYVALYSNPMAGVEIPDTPPTSRVAGQSPAVDALLERDPFGRAAAIAALAGLDPEAMGDLREALGTSAVDRDAVEVILLVRLWARYDPAAATEWAFKSAPTSFRSGVVMAVAEEWAARDPQAAAEGIHAFTLGTPGIVTEAAEMGLMRGWYDSGDYAGLEDFLLSRGVSFDQQRAIKTFARRMTQHGGPAVSRAWAESIPDEPARFKLGVFRHVGAEIAKADPAAARDFCVAHCDGPFGSNLRKQIGIGWATHDGEAALEWLSTTPEGKERDLAVLTTFRGWWQTDRGEEARHWIEATGRDDFEPWMAPAVVVYAPPLALTDPVEALKWAALAPESRREGVLLAVARRWRANDEAAADAWLEQSALSEEFKAKARMTASRGKNVQSIPAPQ